MSATVTLWKPAVWTAAITARSRRSRCAPRTSSAGSPLRPRGRPRSPSWVPASSPSCLTSGHAPTMSSVLKYAIVLLRPLGSPDRRALRGPHERDYSRTSHRPQRGVVAVAGAGSAVVALLRAPPMAAGRGVQRPPEEEPRRGTGESGGRGKGRDLWAPLHLKKKKTLT